MAARIRRAIQTGVDLIRGALVTVKGRSVPDLAVLIRAEAVHEAALVLQDNFINPDPERFAAVVQGVRHQIGGLDATRMRGDVSGLDAIKNNVSRAICEQQLDLIDRLHLLQAVLLGVEQGLRDQIAARPAPRIRDGPEPGGQTDKFLAHQRSAATAKVEPVQAVGRDGENDSHRTEKAPAEDHWPPVDPGAKDRDRRAAGGKDVPRRPATTARSRPGRESIAQYSAERGTRPIAADTPDL